MLIEGVNEMGEGEGGRGKKRRKREREDTRPREFVIVFPLNLPAMK